MGGKKGFFFCRCSLLIALRTYYVHILCMRMLTRRVLYDGWITLKIPSFDKNFQLKALFNCYVVSHFIKRTLSERVDDVEQEEGEIIQPILLHVLMTSCRSITLTSEFNFPFLSHFCFYTIKPMQITHGGGEARQQQQAKELK